MGLQLNIMITLSKATIVLFHEEKRKDMYWDINIQMVAEIKLILKVSEYNGEAKR